MELKLQKESICINEIVFDGTLEQSVELDYLLPDYCQSIFKVLKCKITPKITAERIVNGKLLIDGVAYIKIIYAAEENYRIRSLTQKQVFSKSIELKEAYEDGVVHTSIKCDYVNCRVVNQRRLDIRGAISIKATVSAVKKLEVLTGASGMGVQINNQQITALDKKLHANKEFSIREEMELAYGKPAVSEILDTAATCSLTDYKLIANKVVLKGEITLHTLYLCEDTMAGPEIMDFAIPFSQIVDLPGVTEEYQCVVRFDVTSVDISLKQNGDGECRSFDAEFSMRACVEADKNAQTQLINDIFSTGYEVQSNTSKIKIEQLMCVVNELCTCKSNLQIPQGELSCVYDISCDFANESCRFSNGCIEVSGNLNVCVLALDSDNMPTLLEKNSPCEMKIEKSCATEDILFSPHISVSAVSYSLISGTDIEVQAEIRVCGSLYQYCFYNVVNTITIDESRKKQPCTDVVLRLYFAECGERIWDIAKRFNTSVDAILLENSLDCDTLSERGMLLIPIIG